MSSTSYNLRDAKVGSDVEVSGDYSGRSMVLTVTKVQLATKGYYVGQAQRVWLSDGTSWTGQGEARGSRGGYRSFSRNRARLILDRVAFDAERAQQLEVARKSARREKLIQLVMAEVGNFSIEELEAVAASVQLEGRVAARSVSIFARELVRAADRGY